MTNLLSVYFLNKKQNNALVFASLLSICLLLIRVKLTLSIFFMFLLWNLFLGFIPYVLSSVLKNNIRYQENRFIRILIATTWLLFLPNSFYIITDFIHLFGNNKTIIPYDIVMLSAFSVAGFLAGLVSLYDIQTLISVHYSKKISHLFLFIVSYLSGFGVYLGRIMRFNSWNVISKPKQLYYGIHDCFTHYEAWVFTLTFGSFLILVLTISKSLKTK
jgi:uncharacterized membrane protein